MSFYGYGVSLNVGLGIPIPVLNAEIAQFTAVSDDDLFAPIVDYSRGYPYSEGDPPGADDGGPGSQAQSAGQPRITSYNVCYTKLLRIRAVRSRAARCWRR